MHVFSAALAVSAAILTAAIFCPGSVFADGGDVFMLQAGIPVALRARPFQLNAGLSRGKFLVAARSIRDPRFRETVILLVKYDSQGAMGLIVNLPSGVSVSSALPKVRELRNRPDKIFIGGPVGGNQVFLLIRTNKAPEGSFRIFDHTYMSSSMTALKRMARDRKKGDRFRVFAGYAGWARGQLEREVAMGSWHVMEADERLIFKEDTSNLWEELISRTSGIMVRLLPAQGAPAAFLEAAEKTRKCQH